MSDSKVTYCMISFVTFWKMQTMETENRFVMAGALGQEWGGI